MPYIKKELRPKYDKILDQMSYIESKGELEYCIYKLMVDYMHEREFNYDNLHETVYAVVHAAHEFERNKLDAREDHAKEKNGDIFKTHG